MPISVPLSHSANIDSVVRTGLFIVPLQVERNVCHELHKMVVGTVVVATLLSLSKSTRRSSAITEQQDAAAGGSLLSGLQHVSIRRTDTHDRQIGS